MHTETQHPKAMCVFKSVFLPGNAVLWFDWQGDITYDIIFITLRTKFQNGPTTELRYLNWVGQQSLDS